MTSHPQAESAGTQSLFPPGRLTPETAQAFIKETTRPDHPPLVPEVTLHLASELVPLWHMTEDQLEARGLPPPFWAFAWAGGQALSRHILDHPDLVRGRRVLDFACGCGIAAIAAMKAGAASVLANDIDPFAIAATDLNGALNGVSLETTVSDLVGNQDIDADVILAGDICYEQPLADTVTRWLQDLARSGRDGGKGGRLVLIGDPGRNFLPRDVLERLETYRVETTTELEDHAVRRTDVWRVS